MKILDGFIDAELKIVKTRPGNAHLTKESLSKDQKESVREIFNEYDENKTGFIDKGHMVEFATLFHQITGIKIHYMKFIA